MFLLINKSCTLMINSLKFEIEEEYLSYFYNMRVSSELETRQIVLYSLIWAIMALLF